MKTATLLPLATLALCAGTASAIIIQNPAFPVATERGNGLAEVATALDLRNNFGGARGRAITVFTAPDGANTAIFLTMEPSPGLGDFSVPVEISSTSTTGNYRDPSVAVDLGGNIHVAYVGPNTVTGGTGTAIWYTRIGPTGTISRAATRISNSTRSSDQPSIAVSSFNDGRSVVIACIGADPTGGVNPDNEVLFYVGTNNGQNFGSAINLTADDTSGEANPVIHLVNAFNNENEPVQGAIVWEKSNQIWCSLVAGATSGGPVLGTIRRIGTDLTAREPSLHVQTINNTVRGMVGHLAVRRVGGGQDGTVSYVQFANLPNSGDFNVEIVDNLGVSNFGSAARPSVIAEPGFGTTLTEIMSRRVTIAFPDDVYRLVSITRNQGGISSSFGIIGGTPTTSFGDTAQYFPRGVRSFMEGPQSLSLSRLTSSGAYLIRVIGREQGWTTNGTEDVVAIAEQGLSVPTPSPTASQTASPAPTSSPTQVPTASPSNTVTPTSSPTSGASPSPSSTSATASPSPSPSATSGPGPTSSPFPTQTQPTPSVSPSPSFTASPVPTATFTPVPPPPPGAGLVINTLRGQLLAPISPDTFNDLDRNDDLVWDAADVALLLQGNNR